MKELSKYLSYILRHSPESIGLALDQQGWASVEDLLSKSAAAGQRIDRSLLLAVVETSDKKRFTLSDDGVRIRAAQGHSVAVDLGLTSVEPPKALYHGTAAASLEAILRDGIQSRSRRQVHLSTDRDTARRVGQRHGKPAILIVDSARMHSGGFLFFRADNGVWLTDHVPPSFLKVDSGDVA